jgi:hypothetical protein
MSELKRFRGAFLAIGAAIVVGAVYVATKPPPAETQDVTPDLFRFEKEDLVGVKVVRHDSTIEMVLKDGEWQVVGETWRPSRSMVRRVAHQIHDLTARAVVADAVEDPSVYGVGDDAIEVTLTLKDGRTLTFKAGDPNPTSVSYYIRPIPGDTVYVVKKSAVDYYRLSLEEFRERRFAWLDADDATDIEGEIGGTKLVFHKGDGDRWKMSSPIAQDANREEIRTILGRTGALKASAFVEDQPKDLAKYGLEPPYARMRIAQSTGETVTLRVGSVIAGTDPQERYVYRDEDDAVYSARDGFLEAWTLPPEKYRNRVILGKHEWDVKSYVAKLGGEELAVTKSAKDWQWPDGSPIPGSTPARVAGRAAEIEAKAFHDAPPAGAGLQPPFASVALTFEEGVRTVTVGAATRSGDEERRYVQVDGDPVVYEVDAGVAEVIEDLFREYGRKVERDAERRVREDGEKQEGE